MLNPDQLETVLISTVAEPTGHERLVVAFRDGEDLFIPLDGDRPANHDFLSASQLYVRAVHDQDEYGVFAVEGHRNISTEDRRRLEDIARTPISVTTEVLHVSGRHAAVGRLRRPAPGFVALVDGSERALRSLGPALALADWYGRPLTVCAVTAGADDAETPTAVSLQLEGTRLNDHDVVLVHKRDLEARLFDLMRQGQIVVASAFGIWAADGRLHGMLNGLVRHNAPAIIGIGPNVADDWQPGERHPVVVGVDASEHAHDVVDKVGPFTGRGPITVVHITTEDPPDTAVAHQVAREINQRFGVPAGHHVLSGDSATQGLASYAASVDAQLLITYSWHRSATGQPETASTSVNTVADATCPVVILSDGR